MSVCIEPSNQSPQTLGKIKSNQLEAKYKMSGWTAEQDRELLLGVIAENPPKKGDWERLSAKMTFGKSAEACR